MTATNDAGDNNAEQEFRAALLVCSQILAKLQRISDAPTSHPSANGITVSTRGPWLCSRERGDDVCNHRNPARAIKCQLCGRPRTVAGGIKNKEFKTSKIPEGVRLNGSITSAAPSRQFSLWGHYHWRVTEAAQRRDTTALLKLATCATRDFEIHMRKHQTNQHANHESAVIELLRNHTGVRAIEVAWYLDVSERWVRRQRALNGRDAEFGEPRGYSEQERRVLALAANKASLRTIAAEVGMSKDAVSRLITRIENQDKLASATSP